MMLVVFGHVAYEQNPLLVLILSVVYVYTWLYVTILAFFLELPFFALLLSAVQEGTVTSMTSVAYIILNF